MYTFAYLEFWTIEKKIVLERIIIKITVMTQTKRNKGVFTADVRRIFICVSLASYMQKEDLNLITKIIVDFSFIL